jgi:hypothetical protein
MKVTTPTDTTIGHGLSSNNITLFVFKYNQSILSLNKKIKDKTNFILKTKIHSLHTLLLYLLIKLKPLLPFKVKVVFLITFSPQKSYFIN